MTAVLHRASWVIPVVSPPIANGGVIVDNGMIVEVGEVAELTASYSRTIEHGGGILMPGLVNTHTHLELSHFHVEGQYDRAGDMVSWINELLATRATDDQPDHIQSQALRCLEDMYADGTALLGDIGNTPSSIQNPIAGLKILFFHELLGLSNQVATFMAASMEKGRSRYTCHAPYSTNKTLLLQVKEHCRENQHLFPIHTAESLAEVEFLRTGQGDFRRFIEDRGSWDGSFVVPQCSPVQYLYDLNLLDSQTLCVHCVHVDERDIQLLAETQSQVCLCLGSNAYIGVGLPPVGAMVQAGLSPCLGTDSLASNPSLSIWREMNLVHAHCPDLTPDVILEMATVNGALALGCPEYGSLAQDQVSMIFVKYGGDDPLDYLAFDSSIKHVTRCL